MRTFLVPKKLTPKGCNPCSQTKLAVQIAIFSLVALAFERCPRIYLNTVFVRFVSEYCYCKVEFIM
jgi:hypothetical protein